VTSGPTTTIEPVPRPRTGTIIRRATKLGISYELRFTYRGEKVSHHIGGSWEGWTEERVEEERKFVVRQVERGEYVPPRAETAPIPAGDGVPSFQVLASIVLARKKRRVSDKTYADLKWRLDTAVDHFGAYPVDQIDVAVADAFVEAKLLEREAIVNAAAAGRPLREEYADPRTGRRHQRRRRGLSNSSINKVLVGVRRVLKEAKRRGLVEHNPLEDPECYLRSQSPRRSFLELAQVMALLEAAQELDREQRRLEWRDVRTIRSSPEPATWLAEKYGVSETLIRRIRRGEIWTERRPREATMLPMVATLVLAGPRISELCKLEAPQLDLAARAVRLPRVKTDAAERVIPMVPSLHDVLLSHRADQSRQGGPAFVTRNGTRQHPDNVRTRILANVRTRANELLGDRGQEPIAHLTPHTLRRTFASLLAEVGVSPRRAMYLIGHTDPTFTMRVYQQVLDMGGTAPDQLEELLGCAVDEAFTLLSGREVWTPKGHSAAKNPRHASAESRP
jgi:integrase